MQGSEPTPAPATAKRGIRRATATDLPGMAGVLGRAFRDDPMVRWYLVSRDRLVPRMQAHFAAADAPFTEAGWMWTTEDGLGVMCLMPPPTTDQERALVDGEFPDIGRFTPDGGARYNRFWGWIAEQAPDEPHWLLDQLAVEPEAQGRGIGAALLLHATGLAQASGRPLLLETGVPSNVALYERFGFRVALAADAPDGGPRIWFMRRDPA